MIRRTSSGTQRLHLLYEERNQRTLVLNGSFGHGVEVGLVGRATTLGNHHELILGTLSGFDVDLSGEVATGIYFIVHVQRRVLRVAQVVLCEGVEHAQRQGFLVLETGPDLLTLLTVDDSRTRVLTERQDATCSDLGIAQELQGDILIIL